MAIAWCQYAGRDMSFDPVAPVTEGPADSFESSHSSGTVCNGFTNSQNPGF